MGHVSFVGCVFNAHEPRCTAYWVMLTSTGLWCAHCNEEVYPFTGGTFLVVGHEFSCTPEGAVWVQFPPPGIDAEPVERHRCQLDVDVDALLESILEEHGASLPA